MAKNYNEKISTKIISYEQKNSFNYKQQSSEFWHKYLEGDTYRVCRMQSTERRNTGLYNDFYEKGTYYCACCGGDYQIFSSEAKYKSGTGWPSFFAPISLANIEVVPEQRAISRVVGLRTEVRCSRCGSHLGHVFDDGPVDKGGKRYCINSKALVFVPVGKTPLRTFDIEE